MVRFRVSPPAGSSIAGGEMGPTHALSPDGQRIVFVVNSVGRPALAVRSFDAVEPHVLPGTEDGFFPFWSPDSRFIGFFVHGKLMKIDVTGGPPVTLWGTWNRDGTIVFAPTLTSGLFRVSAAGGAPTPVTTLDAARKEQAHRWPWFLPDGRRFLYLAGPYFANAPTTVFVGSLDSEERTPLFASDSQAIYADGYLLFMRQGTLLAQSFDAARLRTMGESFPVAESVTINSSLANAAFSASTTGVLTYRTGTGTFNTPTQLIWVDRAGTALGSIGQLGVYRNPELSPDGQWLTYASTESGRYEVYVQSFPSPGGGKWQISKSGGLYPRWRRDGRELFYYALDGALMAVPMKSASTLDVGAAVALFQARM